MSQLMKNPFISNNKKYSVDGEYFEFTPYNLKKHFKNVYVFCKFNNYVDCKDILMGDIDIENLNDILKMFTLYESNISLVYNTTLFSNIVILDSDFLKDSNYFGYELPETILVLPIFNISFLNIQSHIDNITDNSYTIEKLYNEIVMKEHLKYNFDNKIIYNLINIISNLNIDSYWKQPKNANLNINEYFNNRKFEYYLKKNTTTGIIASAMFKINKDIDYFEDIIDKNVNNIKSLKTTENKYSNKYFFSKEGECSKYTNDDINGLFEYFLEKKKLNPYKNQFMTKKYENNINDIINELYFKLFRSKDYCHHILNNKKLNSGTFYHLVNSRNNGLSNFINTFRYAWTKLYMDERAKESYLNTNDDIVFDIHTASRLPYFSPPSRNRYIGNPYVVIPINSSIFNNNIFGINYSSYSKDMGVVDLQTFRNKMNTFICGNENFNIFEGIDFKENKMGITGSVMPACLHKNNPLRLKFDSDYRYFAEYYCNSDIDIMIQTQDTNEFLNISNNIFEKIKENHILYFESDKISKYLNKHCYVSLNPNFVKNKLPEMEFEYVKNNLRTDKMLLKILPFIEEEYKKYIDSLNLDENNKKLMEDFDAKNIRLDLYDTVKDNFNDITIRMNLKFKINSAPLSRELELFMNNRGDFMNMVSKFHLPCVRAYYNGDNVYMTPSCITSYMTMMNLHYRYFSGQTTPMEIINKYRMRGFGILLNKKEIKELFKYSCDNEFWRNLYDFNKINSVKANMKKFLTINDPNYRFYEPRKYNAAFFIENDYVEDNYKNVVHQMNTVGNKYLVFNIVYDKTNKTNDFKAFELKEYKFIQYPYTNGNLKTIKHLDINISPGFANALNYSSNHQNIQQDDQEEFLPEFNSPELNDLNTSENEPINDIINQTEDQQTNNTWGSVPDNSDNWGQIAAMNVALNSNNSD